MCYTWYTQQAMTILSCFMVVFEGETMNNEVEIHGGSTDTPTNEEPKKGWRKVFERAADWLLDKDNKNIWLNEMRGNLSLIATVIATMTFQMALNPPGGVRSVKDDGNLYNVVNANPPGADETYSFFVNYCSDVIICPGQAVLAITYPDDYFKFLVSNTICFVASLSICLLLVSGIRLHHRLPMWTLSIMMCITLTSLALSYITSVQMTTPDLIFDKADKFLQKLVFAWMGLLSIIALYHTLRLVLWGITFFCKRRTMAKTREVVKEIPVR